MKGRITMSNKALRFFVTIFLISIFALYFTLDSSAFSATATAWGELSTMTENEPFEVKEAAVKEAWQTFHNEILKNPEGYRFSDKEEANSIEIGPAFQLFEIDNSEVRNNDNKLFSDIIKSDNEWAYILYSNGSPKCLMIVIKMNGKYILNRGGEPAGHLVKSLKRI